MNNNFKILFDIVMEFSRIFKNEALKQCIRTFDSVGQRENGTLFSFSFHSCARFWEHFDEIFFFHLSIYKWNDREDESAQIHMQSTKQRPTTMTMTITVRTAMATATTAAKWCDYVMQSIRHICNVMESSVCFSECMSMSVFVCSRNNPVGTEYSIRHPNYTELCLFTTGQKVDTVNVNAAFTIVKK